MSEDEYDPTTWDDAPEGGTTLLQYAPNVSLSVKGGPGYDAPLLTLRGPDVAHLKDQGWRLASAGSAAREAFENDDILLGLAALAAEFTAKAQLVGLTQKPAEPVTKNEKTGGYETADGKAATSRIQQAGRYIPGWAVGREIPIGDKSGLPMTPRESRQGADREWRGWLDPRPQDAQTNGKDKFVSA